MTIRHIIIRLGAAALGRIGAAAPLPLRVGVGPVIFLLLALAACTNGDDGTAQLQQALVPISVSAVVDDGATVETVTRATGSGDLNSTYHETQFNDDVAVDLFVSNAIKSDGSAAGNPICLKTANVGTTRLFKWYSDDERTEAMTVYWPVDPATTLDFYAYYPAGLVSNRSSGTTTVTVSTDQGAATAPTLTTPADKPADILYAQSTGVARTSSAVPLTFTHQMSKLTVALVAGTGITATDLQSATVTLSQVCTSGSLNNATGAITSPSAAATVTVKAADNASLENYCLLPPGQTVTGQQVNVSFGTHTLTYDIPQHNAAAIVLAAGCNYRFVLTVSSSGITAQSLMVTPWTTAAEQPDDANMTF